VTTITWLHISDLHFRGGDSYDADVVLRALLQDVAERIESDGLRPDFIAVTGDLAFSGKPAEYEQAAGFFDQLLATTGLDKQRLFVVPGNHDVERDKISTLARRAGESLNDQASTNGILGNKGDRAVMLDRFPGYTRFVKNYLGGRLLTGGEPYYYVQPLSLAG
jgi:predicted MPP superfamily phosphohydrolase